MSAVALRKSSPDPAEVDHFVHLHGTSWREYEALLAMRGERSTPRIAYLAGELELMAPSVEHEVRKKRIGGLVEAWSQAMGIEIEGVGSWTIKSELKERGLEPDECYVRGRSALDVERPDLAIEVVWTSGGIDKLAIYRGLGVPEVWFWQNEGLAIHVLENGRYRKSKRSRIFPELDPELIERHMTSQDSQWAAVRALRQEVEER